jgi:hypothetical protein
MEALMQQVQELLQRQQAAEANMRELREENVRLNQQRVQVEGLPALAAALERQFNRPQARTLVDSRGLGKPPNYEGKEGEWMQWSRKFENYVSAVHAGADTALEWAADRHGTISEPDIEEAFGALAPNEAERIEHIAEINFEVYVLLTQYMSGDSFDIVMNCPRGQGLEAYRRLARRHDPSTGGRRRNLLRTVLQPGRSSLENLASALERWEEQVRRYERFRDERGNRQPLSEDIKMASLESLVPDELERHLQLNATRLPDYDAAREEVRMYVEARAGLKLKERAVTEKIKKGGKADPDPNAMDVDSIVKGGKGKKGKKGKGKGKGSGGEGKAPANSQFQGECRNCGKWGHRESECWSPKKDKNASAAASGGNKPAKGAAKGGKAAASVEETKVAEVAETGAFDLCAVGEMTPWTVTDEEGKVWSRFNLDTGAAVTVFPKGLAEPRGTASRNTYKTASGEYVEDLGEGIVSGLGEDGHSRRLRGRIAEVHKPLIAASAACEMGNVVVLRKDGGLIIPVGHSLAKSIEKIVDDHPQRGGAGIVNLYVERGVYNFYLQEARDGGERTTDLAPYDRVEAQSSHGSGGRRQA